MTNLGDFFDFAVNANNRPCEEVWRDFATSQLACEFERGNPKFVVGLSGYELFFRLFNITGQGVSAQNNGGLKSKSREFWAGWFLAYYQWAYNTSFKEIHSKLTFEKLLSLYNIYHEIDEHEATKNLHERLTDTVPTKLSLLRKARLLKQSELAELSGVSLRSIQMYEQRNKDINKAQSETLRALSRVLSCSIEELLEN
ncbi:MAG: helix-turn-helix transcriptional regulator [Firmicutes bacterium]|nr:helix-turn-helix transcriptional regulator [Bacillota bacterium]